MPYPWYEVASGSNLQQGDILTNCVAPLPPTLQVQAGAEPLAAAPPVNADKYDRVIVLSQSCDLADGDLRRVMVCPTYVLAEYLKVAAPTKSKEDSVKDSLRKGRRPAYHLLNLCDLPGNAAPHLVCDFGDAFAIPLEYASLLAATGERIRLLPPYREQLAQNFARFYMRVGLPVDVHKFP